MHAGCETSKLEATVRTIVRECARVRRGPIARAELRRAKDYYAGQLVIGLEDTMDQMLWMGEQAVTVGRIWRPQQLLTHVARVTARDIRRVARHLFVPQKMHLAIVGPVAEPEAAQLAALWHGGRG